MPNVKLLAQYLESNPALTELNLRSNGITTKGAEVLALALKKNTNLQHLDLSYNSFTDKSVPALADALQNNSTLLSLDLMNNKFKVNTGKAELVKSALCDATSLQTVADSNHTCKLILTKGHYGEALTHEGEMRNINSLDNEGQKIRFKVVLALFAMNKDLFDPRSFDDVPLELIPRLLELIQQEVGYKGFGKGVFERTNKHRKGGNDPTLGRVFQTIHEWPSLPLLFVRGAGKLKKKRQRKRKVADEDEDWAPKNRVLAKTAKSSANVANKLRGKRVKKKVASYADVEDEEDDSNGGSDDRTDEDEYDTDDDA